MGRYPVRFCVVLLLLASAAGVMAAGPVGHFLMGKQLIANINGGRCPVGPELRAILKQPDAQRAFKGGAVGPDICEAKSHYGDTAALAGRMLNDAMARYKAAAAVKDEAAFKKARLELAFAYGWYTHCAEDLNVHPRVNGMAGDTFRYNTSGQKAIHAAQEAQLTAYVQSVAGKTTYDIYVPFDFLARHVGLGVDDLKAGEAKLRAKVAAELLAASKVKLTDQIRESWRTALNGSLRDAETFLKTPAAMQKWDLDCGRISTAEFDELRKLAIEANGGTLPAAWGKSYLAWHEKTKGMTRAQKLAALKAFLAGKPAATPPTPPSAATGKKRYAWVLTSTQEFNPVAGKNDPNYSIAGSNGNYTMRWHSQGCYVDGCPGEAFGVQFTCSQPPPIIESNATITLNISGTVTENTIQHYSSNASMDVFFDRVDIDPGAYGGGPGLGGIRLDGKADKAGTSSPKTVRGSPGKGYEANGKMALIVALYNGRSAGTKFIYEWKQVGN